METTCVLFLLWKKIEKHTIKFNCFPSTEFMWNRYNPKYSWCYLKIRSEEELKKKW